MPAFMFNLTPPKKPAFKRHLNCQTQKRVDEWKAEHRVKHSDPKQPCTPGTPGGKRIRLH